MYDYKEVLESIVKTFMAKNRSKLPEYKKYVDNLRDFDEGDLTTVALMVAIRGTRMRSGEYNNFLNAINSISPIALEQLSMLLSALLEIVRTLVHAGVLCSGKEPNEAFQDILRVIMLYLLTSRDYVINTYNETITSCFEQQSEALAGVSGFV